jgi:subtilisin family serine protease
VIRHALALCFALLLAACAGAGPSKNDASTNASAGAAREVLLTVRQPDSLAIGLTGTPNQRYAQRRYGPTPSVERILTQLAREHRLERVDGWPIASLSVYCEVFAVTDDRPLDAVIAELKADSRVELVQRMNVFETQAAGYDDPYADLQTSSTQMDIADAHRLATGRGVSIAIIDSAIDASHPDLHGRVRVARNFVDAGPAPRGGEVHGTAIAGIIASAANNRLGIVGVAPDVTIASLRACWAVTRDSVAAQCSSFSLARALEVAIDLKPNVVNLSLAGPDDPLLGQLLDEMIARGIIVVAAQPERGQNGHEFPSSHPGVLAAHSAAEVLDSASPYVIGAPATDVLTTTPGAQYAFLSGNSLAAANTSGVVALLVERDPHLNVARIAEVLTDTTTHEDGRASINACRALERLTDTTFCAGAAKLVRF